MPKNDLALGTPQHPKSGTAVSWSEHEFIISGNIRITGMCILKPSKAPECKSETGS